LKTRVLGWLCPPFLKPYGPQLGPKLLSNKSNLGSSCAVLEPSWAKVGPKLEPMGRSWAEVGALLAEVDPKSGQCCGHVGSERCIWAMLGRSTKRANYQSRALFGTGRTWPSPAEAVPDCQSGPFVALAATLRLGTFGAGRL